MTSREAMTVLAKGVERRACHFFQPERACLCRVIGTEWSEITAEKPRDYSDVPERVTVICFEAFPRAEARASLLLLYDYMPLFFEPAWNFRSSGRTNMST